MVAWGEMGMKRDGKGWRVTSIKAFYNGSGMMES